MGTKYRIMNTLRNSVLLIGLLGADPEFKTLENGRQMTKFSLATNDFYSNKNGDKIENTQWHNIVAWGKTAENMGKLLKKGKKVVIRGKLDYRQYEGKDGTTRYFTQIVANEFELFGKPELVSA